MSRCLRYQNAIICNHLASQYVAGVMQPRVLARTEQLLKTTPELERAVARYADDFSLIHQHLPEQAMDKKTHQQLWQNIDQNTASDNTTGIKKIDHNLATGFWNNLFIWKISSGVSAMSAIVLAFMLWFTAPTETGQLGPSYLANMAASNDPQKNIQFVISAYSKNQGTPSRIHVQWSKDFADQPKQPLHVWTEDKTTGELSYIGVNPPAGKHWNLTKYEWKKIANSSRLLVTRDKLTPTKNNTLFSGLCLQLKNWKVKKV